MFVHNTFKFIGTMSFQLQANRYNYFYVINTMQYFHNLTTHVSTMQYCFIQY